MNKKINFKNMKTNKQTFVHSCIRAFVPLRFRAFAFSCFFALSCFLPTANAQQQNNSTIHETIDFVEYINLVGQSNLGFLAEKFNVRIAEAEAISQRIFPDPEFSVNVFDNSDRRMLLGRGLELELEQTIELGGKRRSRMRLAKSETEMAEILLRGAFADLQAEAAVAFLESQRQKLLLELRQNSYEAMSQLYQFDAVRHRLGEISEVELLQTRLETAMLQNEIFEQEAELKSSLAELNELAGRNPLQLLMPSGTLSKPVERNYVLGFLLEFALDDHVDLVVVMQQKRITRDQLRLTRAERVIDLGVNVGYEFHTEAFNEEAPTPQFSAFRAGVTIPLRFSNVNRGALHASQHAVEQAEMEYAAAELQIKREISQAFFVYESRKRQVAQFESGMLDIARRIFDGVMFSYRNGEARLLEVLMAQRDYNEVRENYIDALFAYASAVVDLNRRSGMWEVEF